MFERVHVVRLMTRQIQPSHHTSCEWRSVRPSWIFPGFMQGVYFEKRYCVEPLLTPGHNSDKIKVYVQLNFNK